MITLLVKLIKTFYRTVNLLKEKMETEDEVSLVTFMAKQMWGVYSTKIEQNIAICIFNDSLSLILLWWLSGPETVWIKFITMKAALFLLVYLVYNASVVVFKRTEAMVHNNRPIIGILSQEQTPHLKSKYPDENYTSYIVASYVKDVESSGARVVPIMIGKNRQYYENIMGKINGILFPGGSAYFNKSNGYADAGQHIFEIAQQLNKQGHYFPIFGTCLGFELLVILASGRGKEENRISCDTFSNLPLHFTHLRSSKMYKDTPRDILHLLASEDITVNSHMFCIVDENIRAYNLSKDWRVTSHSYSEHGVEFIASIEHRRYPFYGVQFHPEKSAFEWKLSKNYVHTADAVKANRYFMDFFVNECRKSSHSFADVDEENRYLIYNYAPSFTGKLGSAYHQCYFFEPKKL